MAWPEARQRTRHTGHIVQAGVGGCTTALRCPAFGHFRQQNCFMTASWMFSVWALLAG